MARQFSNLYTVCYITAVSTVCALALSLAATALHDRQEANISLFVRQKILTALAAKLDGVKPGERPSLQQVDEYFKERVIVKCLDFNGQFIDKDGTTVNLKEEELKLDPATRFYPLYAMVDKQGAIEAYAFPIYGKGLWSTVYGYLALDKDMDTVRGVTFYGSGETPGLGQEVENPPFQAQWPGKKILDDNGKLVSITVAKGKAADRFPKGAPELMHHVDGVSGATMTGNGVNKFLIEQLEVYEKYFSAVKSGKVKPLSKDQK